MDSKKLIRQEIIDHNLQVKAIIQVSPISIFFQNISGKLLETSNKSRKILKKVFHENHNNINF